MKKLFSVLLLTSLVIVSAAQDGLSEKDRKFALDYLKETKERLIKNVTGLSDAQLNWKPADSVWSVANCIEHIAITEKGLFDYATGPMNQPADPSKRSEVKQTDEGILKMITDRSFKAKAPESIRPTGITAQEALKLFIQRRENSLKYITDIDKNMRNHFVTGFFLGTIDAYQMILFMSGHTLRHTMQIEELKKHPGFPKS
jgi:hypothetical protein